MKAMWSDIELRDLRVFLALAEELHFGRTAERLQISPARVSQVLRHLERTLGGQLVHRTSRRVELTALGEQFLSEAGKAYEQLASVLERTHARTHALQGSLRLGLLTPVLEGPHLPAITRSFTRRHPECTVEVVMAPYGDAFDSVRRGELDLLASWIPHGQADMVTGPTLTRERRVLAVGSDHPLAARASVSVEDLADYRVLPDEEVFPQELASVWSPRRTPSGRAIPRLKVPFGQLAREDPSQLRQQMSWWIQTGQIVYPSVATVEAVLGPNIVYVPITDLAPLRAALVWMRRGPNPRARDFVRVARSILSASSPRRTETRGAVREPAG